jgi:hypothetical protein
MGTSPRGDRTLTVSGAAEWAPRVGDYSISRNVRLMHPYPRLTMWRETGRRESHSAHRELDGITRRIFRLAAWDIGQVLNLEPNRRLVSANASD